MPDQTGQRVFSDEVLIKNIQELAKTAWLREDLNGVNNLMIHQGIGLVACNGSYADGRPPEAYLVMYDGGADGHQVAMFATPPNSVSVVKIMSLRDYWEALQPEIVRYQDDKEIAKKEGRLSFPKIFTPFDGVPEQPTVLRQCNPKYDGPQM